MRPGLVGVVGHHVLVGAVDCHKTCNWILQVAKPIGKTCQYENARAVVVKLIRRKATEISTRCVICALGC